MWEEQKVRRVPDSDLQRSREVLKEMEHPGSSPVAPGGRVGSGAVDRPLSHRHGPRRWSVVALSVLGSAASVSAVGCLCAFIYPILKELRAGRVRGEDGTEVRILGFWSILVMSVVVGCIGCVFSWTLTYLDSYQPGKGFLSPLALAHLRDEPGHRFHVGYGAVILNGIMAMLTVFWILT